MRFPEQSIITFICHFPDTTSNLLTESQDIQSASQFREAVVRSVPTWNCLLQSHVAQWCALQ